VPGKMAGPIRRIEKSGGVVVSSGRVVVVLRLSGSGRQGWRVLGFIGRRCGWCRSVRLVNAAQTGWILALQIQFWTLTSCATPWRTEDMLIGIVGARKVPNSMAGQFSGGSWMEGRSTAGDGH
jgi:hypothetical protein